MDSRTGCQIRNRHAAMIHVRRRCAHTTKMGRKSDWHARHRPQLRAVVGDKTARLRDEVLTLPCGNLTAQIEINRGTERAYSACQAHGRNDH
jgi:hypothetical protein